MSNTKHIPVVSDTKITKKQIDEALAQGKTHAKFTNKSVQRRLLKNQEKIRRAQQLRENQYKRLRKAQEAAKNTIPPGGLPTGALVDNDTNLIINPQTTPDTTGLTLNREPSLERGENVKITVVPIDKPANADPLDGISYDPSILTNVQRLSPFDNHGNDGSWRKMFKQNELTLTAPVEVDLQPNQVPLNLYGDEVNYKPFPEVGDLIRPDGLLAAIRTFEGEALPSEEEKIKLQYPDYIFDKLIYAPRAGIPDYDFGKLIDTQADIVFNPCSTIAPMTMEALYLRTLRARLSSLFTAFGLSSSEPGVVRNLTDEEKAIVTEAVNANTTTFSQSWKEFMEFVNFYKLRFVHVRNPSLTEELDKDIMEKDLAAFVITVMEGNILLLAPQ